MPDNLTIQISADTGKARADLELLKGKLRDLGKEMRAARDEAMKTGDRTNLDRLAKEYDAVSRSAKGLQQQLRATNAAVASPAWGVATKGAAALNAEILNLAKSGLGIGAGIGGALLATVDLIGKTKDQLLELRRISQSTGFSPGAIKAVNETLEDTGQEAGAGNKALIKLSQAFATVRQEARAAGTAIGGAMTVMRPDDPKDQPRDFGVETLRGGQAPRQIKDAADAFAVLGVNMRRFKDDAKGNDAALQAIIDGFERLRKAGKIDAANLASMQLFGKGMREMVPALQKLAEESAGLQKKQEELRTQGRDASAENIQRAADYQKALKDVGDQVDAVGFALLKAFLPTIKEGWIAHDIGELQKLWHLLTDSMVKDVQEALPDIVAAFGDMFAQLTSGFTELGNIIAGWARTALDAIKSVAAAIGSAVGSAVAAGAGSSFGPGGFAGGGMIRGPGTGTSDSILARLSNGEFVMRAEAVNRWGPQFMSALNNLRNPFGFAQGGLVPRFAAGGLVAAGSGGTPVHLHLGGHSFALSGSESVVSSLVTEAHRQRMRSAGTKPSWYGGH